MAGTSNSANGRKVPPWSTFHENDSSVVTGLRLLNSFTRQKDLFKPIDGNKIKFYVCGPTVYDASHMGHARTYLSLDILRRILSEYFKYDIRYVMNITDIDDKIIKRARQHWLFEQYKRENGSNFYTIGCDVSKALEAFRSKVEVETDPDKKNMQTTMLNEVHLAVVGVESQLKDGSGVNLEEQCQNLLRSASSVLADWLDTQYGDTVTDHSIFSSLATKYEDDYFQDMTALNVKPPNVLTRVSEYIPEIIQYIEKIIDNGYAYQTSDGSVYFDTARFQANDKHFYAKLVPEAVGDRENEDKHMKESEGELSLSVEEKKNSSDFALWKASKAGEPFWPSPWGKGRPGWHIECSAMCSTVCGRHLDIHAGGFDLKFPHHDNEIAQCEAHFDESSWVNYFLHCGTLRIAGSKMSKSLKNFITIKDALKKYTSRQLRILFLTHNWSDVLNYSDQTMEHACGFEKEAKDFILLVKDIIRKKKAANDRPLRFREIEDEVWSNFVALKEEVHLALCDSMDTRTVTEKMRSIIKIGNKYIQDTKVNNSTNALLLTDVSNYLVYLFDMFGVEDASNGFVASSSGNSEDLVMPILTSLADIRLKIKNESLGSNSADLKKWNLELCDEIRDDIFPSLGARLEDDVNSFIIKLEDKATLMQEREKKLAEKQAKLEARKRKEEEAALKEAQKRIPPEQWFRVGPEAAKYSQLDEDGIPTHTIDGKEISKGSRGKLIKACENQRKAYAKIMEGTANGSGVKS